MRIALTQPVGEWLTGVNWRLLKKINDVVLAWLGAVALLGGGLFGLVQYVQKERSDRVKETLVFVERSGKEPFFDAQKRLSMIQIAAYGSANPAQETPIKEYHNRLLGSFTDIANVQTFYTVLEYYEALNLCVDGRICDEASAHLFFGAEARRFLRAYLPLICKEVQDKSDDSIGEGVTNFVMRYKEKLALKAALAGKPSGTSATQGQIAAANINTLCETLK